jgi:signal transduction histidine kinase/ligand-binding sensor domain-containing protein
MLLTWSCGAPALNAALDVSQYAHTAWRIREGFTNGEIGALAQTPDGYLWLGTEFGLSRFDGVRNALWQPPAAIPDSQIRVLLAARDGTLWLGTALGLASWNGGKLTNYPEIDRHTVNALLEDRAGTIWVGGSSVGTGFLCAIGNGITHCSDSEGDLPKTVLALWEDDKGHLWVAMHGAVCRWTPAPRQMYAIPDAVDSIQGFSAQPGAMLFLTSSGIQQLIDGDAKEVPLPNLPATFRLNVILRDREGALWIGTRGQGLLHIHDGRVDSFGVTNGLSGDRVWHLFEDREGNIWVTTDQGLDRFRTLASTTYSALQGVNGSMASVLAGRDGNLWLSTTSGLYKRQSGYFTVYRPEHRLSSPLEPGRGRVLDETQVAGLPEDPAASLYQDREGRLWIGTPSELGYLQKKQFISLNEVPHGYIDSIAGDDEGNLWIAHRDAGLLRLSSDLKLQERFPWKVIFGASGDVMRRLAADPVRGGLWLGSFSGGIAYFNDGQVRASYGVRNGLGKGSVNDIRVAADGTVWISTQGGLSAMKAGRIATLDSQSGLPCDGIDSFIDDGKGSAWLYTDCGLVRIASSDLESWVGLAQQGKTPLHITVLASEDGVRSARYGPTFSPHMASSPDGKIWFVTPDGLSVVDPDDLGFNKLAPPVHVEQIIANRKTYEPGRSLALPPLIRELELQYTALSLVAPEKNQFRYKLEGHDRDWQNVGNRRQAYYTDLPPGKYRFRVIASNNSGVWNNEGATLDFSIAPAYWQTTWFRALCAVAFAGLLWMLYLLRLRQVARDFERTLDARVAERTRIARDLHDTLLQSFNGVLLHFGTAARLVRSQPEAAQKLLDESMAQARRAVKEGREAVQDLRSSTEEPNDLAEAISCLAEELTRSTPSSEPGGGSLPHPIDIRVQVDGQSRRLHPIIRDEVYRIAAEALRNALQHAQATQIEVELRYSVREFRLQVRDDGRGIDQEILATGGREGHFGMRGIHERAELAGGTLKVWSAPGSGTEVEVTIPASKAYAAARSRADTTHDSTKP